jgi:UDP-glucose 4-epimerase
VRAVAVTGIGTFLGRRLAERLAARPRMRVHALDRRRPYGLDARVPLHPIDLTRPTADADLADVLRKEEVHTVVHLAFRRAPTPDLEADHELETIGSLHLIHACAAAGVRKLVLGSSTMVYGPYPDNPAYLEETHPLRGHPHAHQVRNRVEVEALVAGFARRHPGTEVTVLRPCWIMGPETWNPVVRYFTRPVVPTLLGYDPMLQLVHEDDVLDAFEKAVRGRHPGVYNVVGREAMPISRLLRLAARRPLPLPAPLVYRLREFPSRAQTGDPPDAFYDYLRYGWVAAGEKGAAAFGDPVYTTREAWMSFFSSRRMRRYR